MTTPDAIEADILRRELRLTDATLNAVEEAFGDEQEAHRATLALYRDLTDAHAALSLTIDPAAEELEAELATALQQIARLTDLANAQVDAATAAHRRYEVLARAIAPEMEGLDFPDRMVERAVGLHADVARLTGELSDERAGRIAAESRQPDELEAQLERDRETVAGAEEQGMLASRWQARAERAEATIAAMTKPVPAVAPSSDVAQDLVSARLGIGIAVANVRKYMEAAGYGGGGEMNSVDAIDRALVAIGKVEARLALDSLTARPVPAVDVEKIVDQPPPKRTDGPPVWDLVIADMHARDATGRARYGTPLQAFNGRRALVDAYQEILDLAVYVRQEIEERRLIAGAGKVP